VLVVELAGDTVRTLSGAMVAYEGEITFKRTGVRAAGGLRGALKRKVTGEGVELMDCAGSGVVYLAHNAAEIELIPLGGQTLRVESSSLLALDPSLKTDVAFAGLRGASSGQGMFTTTVTGDGTVAVLSDGPAVALTVSPSYPLVVDPDVFIASLGQVTSGFVTDISWRSVVGEGSGEPFSIRFTGNGVVYIQPAER
jgi:uncharacterized protein (AIM24 family)